MVEGLNGMALRLFRLGGFFSGRCRSLDAHVERRINRVEE